METMLTRLFEYQTFEPCASLQQVIDSVHARYSSRSLDIDDLKWVSAAGNPDQCLRPTDKKSLT